LRVLIEILKPLQLFNDFAGRFGRSISVTALALMVFVILLQVFCRYILNNALPWPDEAARFLMLWLTGLMAPIALRQSGFVAIDTLHRFLPHRGVSLLAILLATASLIVLFIAVQLGWKHVTSGWLFSSSSLRVPLYLIGFKMIKLKLAWMYLSILTGVVLMILVNIEIIIRQILILLDKNVTLRPIPALDRAN
jgi:TRAP-type C4-dicarboxylate transport system permease small subunit